MATIFDIQRKYRDKIDYLDLELIIAHAIGKSREFVLTHPEHNLVKSQKSKVKKYLERRINHEPLAYILGEKEFYGLKFKVDKNTLIPRPETEMMVDLVIQKISTNHKLQTTNIIDVGTGSGNIIIALAHKLFSSRHSRESGNPEKNNIAGSCIKCGMTLFGIDISKEALKIAKRNAKLNKVSKKIKFLHGNLLNPIIRNPKFNPPAGGHNSKFIILANLPYLSPKIYASCSPDIKKFEPKTALLSQKEGLSHYENLLKSLAVSHWSLVSVFMEISPEQKDKINKFIKKYFPSASWRTKITFHKDLSGRWRICQAEFRINF